MADMRMRCAGSVVDWVLMSKEERRQRMRDKWYIRGFFMCLFGAAGMAEHIQQGRASYPIAAAIFGIGFILICFSYGKE